MHLICFIHILMICPCVHALPLSVYLFCSPLTLSQLSFSSTPICTSICTHTQNNLKSASEYLFTLGWLFVIHEPQEMIWGWWKFLAQISVLFFGRCCLFRQWWCSFGKPHKAFILHDTSKNLRWEFDKPHDRWIEHRSLWNFPFFSLSTHVFTHTLSAGL